MGDEDERYRQYAIARQAQMSNDARCRWLHDTEIPRLRAALAAAEAEFRNGSWRPSNWDLGDFRDREMNC